MTRTTPDLEADMRARMKRNMPPVIGDFPVCNPESVLRVLDHVAELEEALAAAEACAVLDLRDARAIIAARDATIAEQAATIARLEAERNATGARSRPSS